MIKEIKHIAFLLACSVPLFSCKADLPDSPSFEYNMKLTPEVSMLYAPGTKADLIHSYTDVTDKSLIMFGWANGSYWMKGDTAKFVSGEWTLPGKPKISNTKTYEFLSYANLPSSGAAINTSTVATGKNIKFTVSDITAAQNDVLFGLDTTGTRTSGDVKIKYSHPFASVRFKFGNTVGLTNVKSISLTGVYSSGETSFSTASTADANGITIYNWTNLGKANAVLSETGLSKSEGDTIATFMVIPQDLTTNYAIVTVTSDTDETMIKVLDQGSWVAGYTTTYALDKIGTVDVSISDLTFVNNGTSKIYVRATITGAWYDGDDIVAPWKQTDGTFTSLPNTKWTASGEAGRKYFYYSDGIGSGESSTKLYESYAKPSTAPVAGATLKLNILVQAIPYNVNKTCQEAFEAL